MKKINLLKQHKILLVLLDLSNGAKKQLKFEDIAVKLFKKFPEDFHLRGYNKYPDSGDSIKRPLYTLRDNGILTAGNMVFTLTDKGIDIATKIKKGIYRKSVGTNENYDRYVDKEIKRIKKLKAIKLFATGHLDEILDTDFYDYLGLTVRIEKSGFISRINTIKDVIKAIKKSQNTDYKIIMDFHNFMFKKFRGEIEYKLNE